MRISPASTRSAAGTIHDLVTVDDGERVCHSPGLKGQAQIGSFHTCSVIWPAAHAQRYCRGLSVGLFAPHSREAIRPALPAWEARLECQRAPTSAAESAKSNAAPRGPVTSIAPCPATQEASILKHQSLPSLRGTRRAV